MPPSGMVQVNVENGNTRVARREGPTHMDAPWRSPPAAAVAAAAAAAAVDSCSAASSPSLSPLDSVPARAHALAALSGPDGLDAPIGRTGKRPRDGSSQLDDIPSTARRIEDAAGAKTQTQDDGGSGGRGSQQADPTPPTPISAGKLLQLQECADLHAAWAQDQRGWCWATVLGLVVGIEPERLVSDRRVPIVELHLADEGYPRLQITLWGAEKVRWASEIVVGELVQLTAISFKVWNGVLSGNTARHSTMLRAWPADAPPGWPGRSGAWLDSKQFKLTRLRELRGWAETHHPWYFGQAYTAAAAAARVKAAAATAAAAATDFGRLDGRVGQLVTVCGEWSDAALLRFGRDRDTADSILQTAEGPGGRGGRRVVLELWDRLPSGSAADPAAFAGLRPHRRSVVIELRHRKLLRAAVSGMESQRQCACTSLRVTLDNQAIGGSQRVLLVTTAGTSFLPLGTGPQSRPLLTHHPHYPPAAVGRDERSAALVGVAELRRWCGGGATDRAMCHGFIQLTSRVVMAAAKAAASAAGGGEWAGFDAAVQAQRGAAAEVVQVCVMPSAAVSLFGRHSWPSAAGQADSDGWLEMVALAAAGLLEMAQPLPLLLRRRVRRGLGQQQPAGEQQQQPAGEQQQQQPDCDLVGVDWDSFLGSQQL